jgi:hypothetical protein
MDRAVVKISSPMLTALHQPQPAVPDTAIAQR